MLTLFSLFPLTGMDTPQPLVVSYLKLPPDDELFLRLRDILQTIRENFDLLALVLAAAQDLHPSSEVKGALKNLQNVAGEHCAKIVDVIVACRTYASSMVKFASSLGALEGEELHRKVAIVPERCRLVIEECDKAIEGMVQLGQEIPSTVSRLTAALNEGDNSRANLVFTEENSRAVNDLIQVVREAPAAIRQVKEHFQGAREHFSNKELFRDTSPLEEEINVIRDRWNGLFVTLGGVTQDAAQHRGYISGGPDIYKAPKLAEIWRKGVSRESTKSDASAPPVTRKAILNTSTPAPAPSEPNAPASVRVPWWRSWWRQLVSCLTIRNLR